MKTNKFPNLIITLAFSFVLNACQKESTVLYDVNAVQVQQNTGVKNNVKSTAEFIAIGYSDLFGTNISQADLNKLNTAYLSFGDKKLIEDMIIRNFLNKPGVIIPNKSQMQADVPGFVKKSYNRFFNREPSEFESWYITNIVNSDTTITPELFYYALMTSNEYRYY